MNDSPPKLRTALRKIWYERDPRQRDWYFFRLRDDYHRMIVRAENPHLIDLTAPDVVEQLRELEELAKVRGDDPKATPHRGGPTSLG